jgi:hypothetical protein
LDPDAILGRLAGSLDALGTGAVDLPPRQRTLRATVDWSVGLLEEAERSLLEVAAIFVDGWTLQAAAQVAGLEEDRALDLSEALARHSLISLDRTELGSRVRMLGTVREFVAERLGARLDLAEIQRRHAEYYRGLAERADVRLRGVGLGEWLERLEAEAGNLAAAVGWYLAHDPTPLPHLFRVLWLFWSARDHLGEARAWVDQLLPTVDSLDPQARAELAWTALVTADEVGDDPAVLAARQRLEPLLAGIDEPFLRAVSELAMAWTAPVVGDLDGALGRCWPPLSSSAARTSRTGRRWPSAPPAWWRQPWAATTTPSGTCARRATSGSGSTTPGWPPGLGCCWAPWRSCGAGWRRPGRCWRRGWS